MWSWLTPRERWRNVGFAGGGRWQRSQVFPAKTSTKAQPMASYLNETLCERGCGADRCQEMIALRRGRLINLGESGHPMNGSLFVSSNLPGESCRAPQSDA